MIEGLAYIPDFLSPVEQADLLSEITALDFEHDRFRGQQLKRGYAQFGFTYVSIGRRLENTASFPDFLNVIREKVLQQFPAKTVFDQCIVTHYPPGAGIGWHTDAPRFGEYIAGISLRASARLQFRPKGQKEATEEILAAPGSLYSFQGPARWDYQHQVIAVKRDRYSLTFRKALFVGGE